MSYKTADELYTLTMNDPIAWPDFGSNLAKLYEIDNLKNKLDLEFKETHTLHKTSENEYKNSWHRVHFKLFDNYHQLTQPELAKKIIKI